MRFRGLTPVTAGVLVAATLICVLVAGGCDNPPPHIIGDPVDSSTPPFTSNPTATVPTGDPLSLMTGAWKGEAGTLTFNADGTVSVDLKLCPTSSSADRFGYTVDCEATTRTDRYGVGGGGLIVGATDPTLPLGIYADALGRLHVGVGEVYFPTDRREVIIGTEESPYQIAVSGDVCTKSENGSGEPIACRWEMVGNLEVLRVDGRVFIQDPSVPVVSTPGVFHGLLVRP